MKLFHMYQTKPNASTTPCFGQVTSVIASPRQSTGCHGIILNPDKFVLGANTIEFTGFEITPDNVCPCRKFLNTIRKFPTPANLINMHSWFGLINQVSYACAITDHMLPFHELLKPGTPFHWNDTLNQLFEESKAVIASEIEKGARIFNKSRPTCLAIDWSKSGIGFWLFQKHCECASKKPFCCQTGWKIALVGSQFTHSLNHTMPQWKERLLLWPMP